MNETMSKLASSLAVINSKAFALGLVSFGALVSAALSQAVGPFILGDELIYARLAGGEADSGYATFLYSQFFSSTAICAEAAYFCGKSLNAFFALVAAIVAVFWLGGRIGYLWGAAIGLLFVSGPMSPFISFFMPEITLGVFSFIALILASKLDSTSRITTYLLAGSALGIASLIKPHALFLLVPVFLLFLAVYFSGKPLLRDYWVRVVSYTVGVLAVKMVGGFALAGSKGLTLFGATYESALAGFLFGGSSSSNSVGPTISSVSGVAEQQSVGFLEALVAQSMLNLLAIPFVLGALLWPLLSVGWASRLEIAKSELSRAIILSLGSILMMALVTVFLTALVTEAGDDHLRRTLFRYTEVFLPFIFGISLWACTKLKNPFPALFFTFIQVLVFATKPFPRVSVSDSAYVRAILGESALVTFLWIAFTVLVVFSLSKTKINKSLVSAVGVFSVVTIVAIGVWGLLRIGEANPVYRNTVSFAAKAAVQEGANPAKTVLLATQKTDAQAALLLSGLLDANYLLRPSGSSVTADEIPDAVEWVVSTQEVYYSGPELYSVVGNGYRVTRIGDDESFVFGRDMKNEWVAQASGLTNSSGSVRYAEKTEVHLRFNERTSILSELELSMTYFCVVDCRQEDLSVFTNGVQASFGGGLPGELLNVKWAIDREEALEEIRVVLPEELGGKVGFVSIEATTR